MCSHREFHGQPPDSRVNIPQTRPLFTHQGEENYSLYTLLVVGDADTGKTSMLGSFAGDGFDPTYIPTIGRDFRICTIELDEFRIKLQIWDTAGQPRFRTLTGGFYRECAAFIITYNTTKEETFENVPYWVEEISRYAHLDPKIVLVGTNCDRVDEKVVNYTRARDFASERQIPFFEVSSKDGTNVELAIMTLVAQLRQL